MLTLDETVIIDEAGRIAERIDAFLIAREGNILSKLLAISADFIPQESFEIQVKIGLLEMIDIFARLNEVDLKPFKTSIREQYDTYLFFKEKDSGRLRFREDHVKNEDGELRDTFYRLTLMEPTSEKEFENSILLNRARYTVSAGHSLRFYREYFKPASEREVIKHRRRCHIVYKDTDFAINLDKLVGSQSSNVYLEIKSRTWSAKDARHKAGLIGELLELLELTSQDQFKIEYVDLAKRM